MKRGGSKKTKQKASRKGNRVNKEGERSTGRVRGEEREGALEKRRDERQD